MADAAGLDALMQLEMDREKRALRYASCVVVNLSFALLFTILNFFVDWSDVRLFNGAPEGGQLNGNLIVALRETVIQQLAGNAPTTIRRADQALYSEYACGTLARLGDFCQGILTKIDTGILLEIVLIFVLVATVASLAYFSWLTHQLRWNLLLRSDENVRVGPYGCLLTEDGLAWSWKGWTKDPCAYITVMAAAVVFAVPFGLIGWVVGVDLLRFRWQIGLLGAFAGLDNGQFVQGIRGVQFMNAGYNMFALTLVNLVIAIVGGVLVRESFRAMIYGDVDKAMGDITSSAMGKSVAVLERWGSWWYNLIPSMMVGVQGPSGAGGSTNSSSSSSSSSGVAPEEGMKKVANPAFAATGAEKSSPTKATLARGAAVAEPSPFDAPDGGRSQGAGLPGHADDFDDESPFGNSSYNRAI